MCRAVRNGKYRNSRHDQDALAARPAGGSKALLAIRQRGGVIVPRAATLVRFRTRPRKACPCHTGTDTSGGAPNALGGHAAKTENAPVAARRCQNARRPPHTRATGFRF